MIPSAPKKYFFRLAVLAMMTVMFSGCARLTSLLPFPGRDTKPPSEQTGQAGKEMTSSPPPSPAPETNAMAVPASKTGPSEKQPESATLAVREPVSESPADFSYSDAILTEDVTWQGKVVIEGVVTVAPQATLTIGPGTVVRFGGGTSPGKNPVLLVQGRLVINGSKERPAVLTSRFADSRKGDWQGVVMLGTEKKNLLENCRFEGAEVGLDVSFSSLTLTNVTFAGCNTGIRLQDSLVSAAGGGARGCDVGMALYESEADLRDLLITGNRSGIVAQDSSIYFTGGTAAGNALIGLKATSCRVKIAAGRFSANGLGGLYLLSSQGSVSGCRITGNEDYGISLSGSRVKVFGNEIAQNGKTGMKVDDGKGSAWGNLFDRNGAYDLANTGNEEFRAMGNWWTGAAPAEAGKRIFDRRMENGRRRVQFTPVLETMPVMNP